MTNLPPFQSGLPASPPEAEGGPDDTPVVILGAGITACAAALYLARSGLSPLVLAPGPHLIDASTRGLGIVMPGLGEDAARLARAVGVEDMASIYQLGLEAVRLLDALSAELSFDWRPGPAVMLARSANEAADLEASIPLLRHAGIPVAPMSAAEIEAEVGTGFRAGLRMLEAGVLDPARLNRALAMAAAAEGARFVYNARVADVRDEPRGLALETARGRVVADMVIHAAGIDNPAVTPLLSKAVLAARVQYLATAPGGTTPALPGSAGSGYEYWRAGADGGLLLGGFRYLSNEGGLAFQEDGFDPRVTARQEAVAAALCGGSLPSITHRWTRFIDIGCDGLPLVGAVPGQPRQLLLSGFAGLDSSYGLICARSLASEAAGLPVQAAVPALFAPRRMA